MITRSAKRKSLHLECDPVLKVPGNEIRSQSQSNISVENSDRVPPSNEQLQNTIFNIKIQSPVYEITSVKISTHPLIQNSSNKVLKTLELNIGNKSEKLTPILGDVELSFESNSAKGNCSELDNNASCQNCLTDIKKGNSKSSKRRSSVKKSTGSKNKTCKSTKEISSHSVDINSIKLKKAVVVLTDICKSKYYKAAFSDLTAIDQVDTNGIETESDFSKVEVKQENLDSSTGIPDNCCTDKTDNALETTASLESIHGTYLSGSRLLTQLAEGCSFSEILNRFRIKNGNCLVDTLNCAETVNHENFSSELFKEHEKLIFKSERVSFSEDEAPLEGFYTSEIIEGTESLDFEGSNWVDLPQVSRGEESTKVVEHLRDQSLDSRVVSDHSKNTTALHSFSEDVTADEEIADSSCLTSDVVSNTSNVNISEEISTMPETSDNHISTTNNSNLNLHESEQPNSETDKEIMKSKKFSDINKNKRKKEKRSKNKNPQHSSSSKKMKQSNQKSNTSHSKMMDEYIPLQVSGPTKFGVATLNQIKPYSQHDAKDFRNKMLFGDRIKRVSSSQHLRIYKLKQEVNRSVRG